MEPDERWGKSWTPAPNMSQLSRAAYGEPWTFPRSLFTLHCSACASQGLKGTAYSSLAR